MSDLAKVLEGIRERHHQDRMMAGGWCWCGVHEVPCDATKLLDALEVAIEALKDLRIDANRLCDRQLGGTYESDCRKAIAEADDALAAIEEKLSK